MRVLIQRAFFARDLKILFPSDLLRLQPRIVFRHALCVAQNASQFGISYIAPRIGRVVVSLSGQRLIVQPRFRRLTSFVFRELAPDIPLAQWNASVYLAGAGYSRRDHQVPAHQRERCCVADSHAVEISNHGATDQQRTEADAKVRWRTLICRFRARSATIHSDSFFL